MNLSDFAPLWRLVRTGILVLTASTTLMASLAVGGGHAAAVSNVNELAPEITASADAAVAALDSYTQTQSPEDERMLAFHRAAAARYVAREIGYDELAMIDAWSTTPLAHQRAVLEALTQVGVPYRTNTSIEDEGFDCSGLTHFAWAGAGVELYRQSGSQISNAKSLSRDEAKAGDLVHYPGHVMLYLGVDDAVVHSVNTGRTVEVDTMRRTNVRFGDPTFSS